MMRVLFVGARPLPDNMESHVIESLEAMGHEVFGFDIKTILDLNSKCSKYIEFAARTLLREPERLREKKLVSFAVEVRPDLVIVLLGNMVSPKTIALLKKVVSVPVVCWCQDALSTMGRQYMVGAPYDLVFVKDHYMARLFNDMMGKRFRYLPEACNPSVHFYEAPTDEELGSYECELATAATLYYYRQEIMKPLAGRYLLKLYGNVPDWLHFEMQGCHTGKYIVGRSKRLVFSSAAIVLNTLHYAEIESVNCRFFEIAGCGGFQLVSEKDEVARHFEVGTEVETFRDKDELIAKIEHYLQEPLKRKDMALRAMKRAHAEHTYKHRLQQLLDDVFKN